jgi:hypothetical protein
MTQSTRTFRVFVSSTFSDLKAERNALQAYVFPRLRELCEENGSRFQPIDLRWGVSEEASLDQQAMSICLGEVARCQQTSPRPNFIVLLGDRYGWCPPPAHIPKGEYDQLRQVVIASADAALLDNWYDLDENAVPSEMRLKPRGKGYIQYEQWQPVEARLHTILAEAARQLGWGEEKLLPFTTSATEQEIHAGALRVRPAPDHVLCFFREIQGLPGAFNAQAFQAALLARIKAEPAAGIVNQAAQEHIKALLQMPPSATARDFAERIKTALDQTPKATTEHDLLSLVRQALVDFSAKDFIDMHESDWTIDEKAHTAQNKLKADLGAYVPGNVYPYQAQWTGNGITTEHVEWLCEDVYQSLSKIILSEVNPVETGHSTRTDTLEDSEGLAQRQFAEERRRFFVGRETIRTKITDYLHQPDRRTLVILGEGGTGKSALMAKALSEAEQNYQGRVAIVYRFIGATAGSSDGRSLLESLCREISRCFGADQSNIPLDYRDLVSEFGKRLALATAKKPLILFLDSLDQLSASQGARSLSWLPSELPEHVSVILSTRGGEMDTYKNLRGKKVIEEVLEGLELNEGKDLLGLWLADVHRRLQPEQEQAVLEKFNQSQCNPLYLKLAFEEARLWTSYQEHTEDLAAGISGIIKKNMIDRLKHESNHGKKMVSHTLGYLAASRNGLSEDEMVDLLSRDLQVYTWFFNKSYHLPSDLIQSAINYRRAHGFVQAAADAQPSSEEEREALAWLKEIRNPPEKVSEFLSEALKKPDGPRLPIVLWSRLSFDLAPYLTERMVDGSPLLYFYHRELGEVSKEVFLAGEQAQPFHANLADYFKLKADPAGDSSWTGNYVHGLSELPYHLTEAGQKDEVFETLTDFKFMEHKAAEVGVEKRKDDQGDVVKTYSGSRLLQEDCDYAVSRLFGGGEAGGWGERPPLILTALETSKGLVVYCPVCNKHSPIQREQLGKKIQCPQADCKVPIKLNPFTVKREI